MEEEIICSHCDQIVYDEDLLRCPLCGEMLDVHIGIFSKLKSKPVLALLLPIILVIIGAFLVI